MNTKLLKKILAFLLKALSIYYAIYLGVWTMGIHNFIHTIQELMAGELSIVSIQFLKNVIAFIFSLSVAGAIWCAGDILSCKFKDKPDA